MTPGQSQLLIGTILLEKNRWKLGRHPSYQVSQWIPRFQEAGFDGMELWEFHATQCPAEELEALCSTEFPISVYSLYLNFNEADNSARIQAAKMAERLKAKGVKYNIGNEESLKDAYIERLRDWAGHFSSNIRLLSECHEGTLMEDPGYTSRVLKALNDKRFELIVHPFSRSLDSLRQWFDELGPAITHAHVQMRDEQGKILRLDQRPELARQALRIMREGGFGGTITLEFTQGVGLEEEDIGRLYENALRDFEFLRTHF